MSLQPQVRDSIYGGASVRRAAPDSGFLLTAVAGAMLTVMLALGLPSLAAADAPRQAADPCPVTLDDVDVTEWQLVNAKGFSFCVPAAWKVSGSRARFSGGTVEWKAGRLRKPDMAFRVGERMTPEQEWAVIPGTTFPGTVDGRSVEFTRKVNRGNVQTIAVWSDPAVYFLGEANSEELAAVQLAVYRTVRFER